jgi:uncharacterized membrane-anchored protein
MLLFKRGRRFYKRKEREREREREQTYLLCFLKKEEEERRRDEEREVGNRRGEEQWRGH